VISRRSCACSVEIATGADSNDSAVDVVRVPGSQAEEQAASGSSGRRTSVGSWISGLHRAGRHIPDAAPTSLVLPRTNNSQFFCHAVVTSPAIEVRSIAMNQSVCLSACISQKWRVQTKFSVHVTRGQVKINVTTVNNRCYPPCWRSLASSSFSAQVHKSL